VATVHPIDQKKGASKQQTARQLNPHLTISLLPSNATPVTLESNRAVAGKHGE